jgi:hypothetical protein
MKLTLMKHEALVQLLNKTADGVERHFQPTVTLGGKRQQSKQLSALLRGHARKRQQAAALYQQWLVMTRDLRRELRKEVIPTMFTLRTYATGFYGTSSKVFTDLGFVHRTRRRPSAPTVALAALKAAATRKARNTVGKKQRKKIRGVVTQEQLLALK